MVVAEQLRHARRDAGLGVEEEDDAALVLLDARLDAVAQLRVDRVLHAAGEAHAARARAQLEHDARAVAGLRDRLERRVGHAHADARVVASPPSGAAGA